jgi:Leucine-rich repeat (LRR) protein
VEHLNLSHNQLEHLQHLHWLSQLTHLDLANNRLRVLDSLHTKLGNVKCVLLTGNLIESLHGQ